MFGLEKGDFTVIMITAVIGFLGGGFLYVGYFAKLSQPDQVATQEAQLEFSLTGEAYGTCDDRCPAFQLQNDGTYRYRYSLSLTEPPTVRDGTLPINLQRQLKQALVPSSLEEQSTPVEIAACNSQSGGVDIRYSITYKGEQYLLDSCGTAIDGGGELWAALSTLWQYLQTVE